MIRGAIFDLDGVLLDSMAVWNDLGARYLQGRGIEPEPGLSQILFFHEYGTGGRLPERALCFTGYAAGNSGRNRADDSGFLFF